MARIACGSSVTNPSRLVDSHLASTIPHADQPSVARLPPVEGRTILPLTQIAAATRQNADGQQVPALHHILGPQRCEMWPASSRWVLGREPPC